MSTRDLIHRLMDEDLERAFSAAFELRSRGVEASEIEDELLAVADRVQPHVLMHVLTYNKMHVDRFSYTVKRLLYKHNLFNEITLLFSVYNCIDFEMLRLAIHGSRDLDIWDLRLGLYDLRLVAYSFMREDQDLATSLSRQLRDLVVQIVNEGDARQVALALKVAMAVSDGLRLENHEIDEICERVFDFIDTHNLRVSEANMARDAISFSSRNDFRFHRFAEVCLSYLTSPDNEVRRAVVLAFGVNKTGHRFALPALERALHDPDLVVRVFAARAILLREPDHQEALSVRNREDPQPSSAGESMTDGDGNDHP